MPSTLVSQSTFPHYSSRSSLLRNSFKIPVSQLWLEQIKYEQYKVHTVKCDIFGTRLYLVSNTKLETEMKEEPDSHCLIKCKLHVALGLTHGLGLSRMPYCRVDARQGNMRNIGKFQGRHVFIHLPCIIQLVLLYLGLGFLVK